MGYLTNRPAAGNMNQGFGPRPKPTPTSPAIHYGQDYGWGGGDAIYAARSGRVKSYSFSGAYGNRLVIDHGDGTETWYCHTSAATVTVGAQVAGGDQVAWMGATGNVVGKHLHFELRINGVATDPAPYFSGSSLAGGTPTKVEDEMTPEQSRKLDAIYDAMFNGGPSMKDHTKSVSQSLAEISATVNKNVLRDTTGDGVNEEISQIQDNADTNSLVRQLISRGPAGTNAPYDYAAIGAAVRNAIIK